MSSELALEASTTRAATGGWIRSRGFDLTFFIFSPLLGFAIGASIAFQDVDLLLLSAVNFLIGVPHYFASFGFFGDGENRAHARQRRLVFFAVPAGIFVGVTAAYATGQQNWIHALIFAWNIYHVGSQSAGIVALYRKLSGGRHEERLWCQRMIVCANGAMAFWALERFPPLYDLLVAVHARLPSLLCSLFFLGGLFFAAGYVRELRRRGFGLSPAEHASLATGLLLFTPFLWLPDATVATFAMLVGHFVQYLAIVWVLNGRKYAVRERSGPGERLLGAYGRSWRGVAIYMLVVGGLFACFEQGARQLQLYVVFMIAFNTLALTHFYVDGLIWAFRNPFIRRSVAPYLTLDANRLR
jgi:hypothetical protein